MGTGQFSTDSRKKGTGQVRSQTRAALSTDPRNLWKPDPSPINYRERHMTSARIPAVLMTLLIALQMVSARPAAQAPAASPEAARIAEGRTLLKQGNTVRAATLGKT